MAPHRAVGRVEPCGHGLRDFFLCLDVEMQEQINRRDEGD